MEEIFNMAKKYTFIAIAFVCVVAVLACAVAVKASELEEIEIVVIYEDTQELPICQQLMHPSFHTEVVRIGYSDKMYRCTIPEAFI